jgi:hypothetical protein
MKYVFLLLIILSMLFVAGCNNKIITLGGVRSDFDDPGPVELECQMYLESYNQAHQTNCILIESKIGSTFEECPGGLSPQGCSICKIKCE